MVYRKSLTNDLGVFSFKDQGNSCITAVINLFFLFIHLNESPYLSYKHFC